MTAPPPDSLKQRKRHAEFQQICSHIKPGSQILELGGETGFQASLLTAAGHTVNSLDVESKPETGLYHPVQIYGGLTIPFADRTFDAVFSSHVLEHVPHLPVLLREIHRVLKPGGVSVHVLPSSVWRFWTSFTHYPYLVQRLLGTRQKPLSGTQAYSVGDTVQRRGLRQSLLRALLSGPHGVSGNEFVELWRFSGKAWRKTFQAAGFEVISMRGSGLLYSGYELFPQLGIERRRQLSQILGSSSHVVLTRPAS